MTPLEQSAAQIVDVLQKAGHIACFAGGCVRDSLLNRAMHDVDIATSAKPDEIERLFQGRTIDVGKSFGVVIVQQDGIPFDVATFREDGEYLDGRHPESIGFAGPREDAARRDFTINAMFFEPFSKKTWDYFGGEEDLRKHIIRTVGEPVERFAEDHLRMLRAIRFASVLNFNIEHRTWEAICANSDWILTVSAERIFKEITRLLCESPKPSYGMELLRSSGLLQRLFPEIAAMHGVAQPPEYHPEGDVWTHTMLMLDDATLPRTPELVWSILLHDVGKPPTFSFEPDAKTGVRTIRFRCHADIGAKMTEEILRRMKASNELIDAVQNTVHSHMSFIDAKNMRQATLRKYMAKQWFPVLLEVFRLDSLHSSGDTSAWEFLRKYYEEFRSKPVLPAPLISGRDLIALGATPGKVLGEYLKRIYDAQLDGEIHTKEDAIALWQAIKN